MPATGWQTRLSIFLPTMLGIRHAETARPSPRQAFRGPTSGPAPPILTVDEREPATVNMIRFLSILLTVCLVAAVARADQRSVLVELFTSEGCSSCPPAHAVLARLAERPGVLALSFHVDYWDYIGWEDTFAAPWASERQRRYAARLPRGAVYTPQVVIGGSHEAVGSIAPRVMDLVNAKLAAGPPPVPLAIERDGTGLAAVLGADAGPAEVYLIRFDRRRESDIRAGENRGRRLSTFNVVRTYRKVADWDGTPGRIPLDGNGGELPGETAAVIVQRPGQGEVIACAVEDAALTP